MPIITDQSGAQIPDIGILGGCFNARASLTPFGENPAKYLGMMCVKGKDHSFSDYIRIGGDGDKQ